MNYVSVKVFKVLLGCSGEVTWRDI